MSNTTHTNPVTGRPFKDENVPDLADAMRARRFSQPQWATFWQWKGTGRLVRKGEKGITLTGSSGFQWRVFNVAQLETGEAEAPRAPATVATPAPAAPARKAKPARGGVKKPVMSGAPSAPAVKVKPHVVVDNPTVARGFRQSPTKRKPGVSGGAWAGTIDPVEALPDTIESVREIVRLNPWLKLTDGEARELVRQHPRRRFFEPNEVAAIYGTGKAALATEQGRKRVADGKRWLALWQGKAKTHRKIGALKTWAWLKFTGRHSEAAAYIKRASARRPGTQ